MTKQAVTINLRMLKTSVIDFLVFKPQVSLRLSRVFFSASSRLSRNFRSRLAGLAQIASADRLSRRLRRLTSSMFTSAPSTPHLEPKPSPISNQPLIDTINLSFLLFTHIIHSSSSNPRHLLTAVNSLLHRKSPSPPPTSIPPPSIADTFCSFFSDKISSLRVTLQSILASQSSTADPPPTPIPPPLPPVFS